MDFFLKHKIVILRTLGGLMLVIGFSIHFWTMPQKGLSANERATANVARMEAKMSPKSSATKKSSKKDDSHFLKELKKTQAKQLQYLTIIAMILGVSFLGYSFLPKKEEEEEL